MLNDNSSMLNTLSTKVNPQVNPPAATLFVSSSPNFPGSQTVQDDVLLISPSTPSDLNPLNNNNNTTSSGANNDFSASLRVISAQQQPPKGDLYLPTSHGTQHSSILAPPPVMVQSAFRIPFDQLIEPAAVAARSAIAGMIAASIMMKSTSGANLINHLLYHQAGSACDCDWSLRFWSEGPIAYRTLFAECALSLGKIGLLFPSVVAKMICSPIHELNLSSLGPSDSSIASVGSPLSLWCVAIMLAPQTHDQLISVIGILHCCDVRTELCRPQTQCVSQLPFRPFNCLPYRLRVAKRCCSPRFPIP
eukprot:GDKJ01015133.1.p1 GENE.GDKJ01015133.1~~GDKJ01015133.1.p1  ORF type:complete len:306 (-),score=64.04 GDKJ01015133.1:246-1163(-)